MPVPSGADPAFLDPAFSLIDATRAFGETRAVDGVSLDFARGETTLLIGTSGSGKSTLLRLLIGLEWPDAGTILHDGEPLQRATLPELRRRVGYVIQDGGLFPHLTVLGNLALLPRHLGWKPAHVRERAAELAELAHLHKDLFDRFPAELSGGQRQRVALMRALMLDPPTLLLDEPLGALDPLVRHGLQDELREIFRRLGKTVIMVTHDLAEAAFFGRRLVLMRRGRVVQDGSLDDFRRAPASDFVREFLAAHRNLPDAAT
ncbi:MAG: ABC transporter, ATP-binding protein (cluster 13, osmolytes) [Rhodanobacteraceae bacterium]|jgi:osmoprotectant transport system ATP-binding protein|nr:MAG: ABC transporter, ATP-binding protein (cluster 13, osmolytes) [Rhodanobacteraceae bacterium]